MSAPYLCLAKSGCTSLAPVLVKHTQHVLVCIYVALKGSGYEDHATPCIPSDSCTRCLSIFVDRLSHAACKLHDGIMCGPCHCSAMGWMMPMPPCACLGCPISYSQLQAPTTGYIYMRQFVICTLGTSMWGATTRVPSTALEDCMRPQPADPRLHAGAEGRPQSCGGKQSMYCLLLEFIGCRYGLAWSSTQGRVSDAMQSLKRMEVYSTVPYTTTTSHRAAQRRARQLHQR